MKKTFFTRALQFTRAASIALCVLLANFIPAPARAAPLLQADDPASQCERGVQLFVDDGLDEALSLVEAGVSNWVASGIEQTEDFGICTLVLGKIFHDQAHYTKALDAYQQALQVFRNLDGRDWEGMVLNNIGLVYYSQGRSAESLEQYQQALVIFREIGNQAGEGQVLNNIGLVYYSQGRSAESLEKYQQALVIFREVGDRTEEGDILHIIGGVYYSQGWYSEALEQYQQALVIRREVGDRVGEGMTLNNIGLVYYSQGRYSKALEQYQQALVIHREVGDRAEEGITLHNIGAVYKSQGRYAESLEQYRQALVIHREVGDRAEEGTTLNSIGVVYDLQGRYAESLEQYQRALSIRREIGDRVGEGVTLHNIGAVYKSQGRYVEALEQFQQVLPIVRGVGDRAGEGTTLDSIGGMYKAQGRYAEALEQYRQALVIRREIGDRAGEGATLNNIGGVYKAQGRYAEALGQCQQALVIFQEVGNRAGEGTTLSNIGAVYHAQGQYAEALEQYQQALVIQREIGDRAGEGTTLNGIGLVYDAQGRYAEALEEYQRALSIRREIGDRAGEGTTLNNIGAVYTLQKRYAGVLEEYQQALAIEREIGNRAGEGRTLNNIGTVYHSQRRYTEALEQYQQALVIQREVGDRDGEGRTLNNIGWVYRDQGRYDEAIQFYEQSLDAFEALRAAAGSDRARSSFIDQHVSVYDHLIELYHQQAQPEQAFYASERGRARSFLDSLATGYVEFNDQTAAALYAREQEAYAVRQTAQDALVKAKAQNPPDSSLIADLEAQLTQAEGDYQAALEAIAARGGQLAQLIPGRSSVLDVSQAQALLDAQTVLLSFWVLDDQTLVFVLTRDAFDVLSLPVSAADLQQKISALRAFSNTAAPHPDRAIELYRMLIAPLRERLNRPHLVIIPHNVLHYLSFAALTDGQRYLVEDYVISYLPSASVLPFIQQNMGHTGAALLVMGNPSVSALSPLPYAEAEAQAIANLYQVAPFLEFNATESLLKSQASQAGVLHIAAHGQYNQGNALYSALYLTPDDANDGLLETHEIYGLNLGQTDLVVLSACETQLGDLSRGDEVVGLTRAFFFAGAPSVVSSLWKVSDQSTTLLMERFYTHIKAGMGKAEALRQAQIDVRSEYPNPYYWAAFVLSGDAGEITADGVSLPQTTTVTPSVFPTAIPASMPGNAEQLVKLPAGVLAILLIVCLCGMVLLAVIFGVALRIMRGGQQ